MYLRIVKLTRDSENNVIRDFEETLSLVLRMDELSDTVFHDYIGE